MGLDSQSGSGEVLKEEELASPKRGKEGKQGTGKKLGRYGGFTWRQEMRSIQGRDKESQSVVLDPSPTALLGNPLEI